MTEGATERQQQSQKPYWKSPFWILSQLAAGVSLVKLIQDLDWVSLKGVIAQWVGFYDNMVLAIVEFLTGWIDVSWLHITRAEAHLVVIWVMLVSALSAGVRDPRRVQSEAHRVGRVTRILVVALVRTFVPAIGFAVALLLPGTWGLVIQGLVLAVYVVGLPLMKDSDDFVRRDTVRYLLGTLGWALLVVLLGGVLLK